jgi:16S rRNA (cytosine1402-N4)-methyltransferase
MEHIAVMKNEVLDLLRERQLHTVFDGTCGGAGHGFLILESHPEIQHYIACDQDPESIERARIVLSSFHPKVTFYNGNFSSPPEDPAFFDAILLDLGVSSFQLETAERGFSFMKEGPLDMRMDPRNDVSAADLVNEWGERELANLFFEYGEERCSRRIAKAIVERRKKQRFSTTTDLAACIAEASPRRGKIHPATKVFQSLRIAVNDELEVLKQAIAALSKRLSPGGVFLVITFHSLEDRIVKQAFRELVLSKEYFPVVKKFLEPSQQEIYQNKRSRSAKLRAVEKK